MVSEVNLESIVEKHGFVIVEDVLASKEAAALLLALEQIGNTG